ncbi:MAG: polyketide synthase dehydratase domain-containing protein [Desulfohalobiaceae bacterium]
MGNLPQIGQSLELPISIQVPGYLLDHAFAGTAVLPAVESMQLLVQKIRELEQDIDLRCFTQAWFEKFLVLQPGQESIEACVEIDRPQDNCFSARLVTRTRHAGSGITRVREHARACLGQLPGEAGYQAVPWVRESECEMAVAADKVYNQLVPFGPAYQNICDTLYLSRAAAVAEICAPSLPVEEPELGSLFVLDGALHAACVWGQRYCGFIGFPMGFDSRYVVNPPQPGRRYKAQVLPVSQGRREGVFELCIRDQGDRIYEVVHGLRMRDVTGGRLQPVDWIQAGA